MTAMTTMGALSINDVSVKRGGRPLLRGVSLNVESGRVIALLGNNGAGKSTLLHIAAGLIKPEQGSVHLNGQNIDKLEPSNLAQQRALLSQQLHTPFDFSAQEVVELGAQAARVDSIKAQAQTALKAVDMESHRHQPFNTLSGGERARTLLARSVVQLGIKLNTDVNAVTSAQRGRYLLLDEPTAALDISHQVGALNWIRQVAARHSVGVLIVMHDLNLAARFADELAVLHDGSIALRGEPNEVLRDPKLDAIFEVTLQRSVAADGRVVVIAG